MGYQIGKVFDDSMSSIERARDRVLQGSPGKVIRTPKVVNTSLDEAMIRAAQDERENKVRRELGLAELGVKRDRFGVEADLGYADLGRKQAADEALQGHRAAQLDELGGYHDATLGLREQEGTDRAARYADRGQYEKGVLAVRQQEAAADAVRAQTAQETLALRSAAENVRSVQQARNLLLKARDLATRRDAMGQIDPERSRAFVAIIRDLEGFLRDPSGKNLPEDVSADARKARQHVAGAAGLGGVDGGDEVDPLLDLGLDGSEDDGSTPPRFGR